MDLKGDGGKTRTETRDAAIAALTKGANDVRMMILGFGDGAPRALSSDPAMTARVRASIEKAIGKTHVIEADRWMASEDFPQLAMAISVPSVYFFVGATPVGVDAATAPTNHSPKFFLDEGALKVGTESMLQVTLDFLNASKSG